MKGENDVNVRAWILAAVSGLLVVSSARADIVRRRDAVVEVVQRVSPSVVHIATSQIVEPRLRRGRSQLEEFFFGQERERQAQSVESLGSGVIIDSAGIIITNDHVIRGAAA